MRCIRGLGMDFYRQEMYETRFNCIQTREFAVISHYCGGRVLVCSLCLALASL